MLDSALPVSLGASAFTVFALGLRHGADPDHLAAIDNLTRNGVSAGRKLSRFFGTLFAGGHSVMVLSIAALAGLLGSRIAIRGELIETVGTWVSIFTLFALAAYNIRQLASTNSQPRYGLKIASRGQQPGRCDGGRIAVRSWIRHVQPSGDIRLGFHKRRRHLRRARHRTNVLGGHGRHRHA